MKKVKQISTVFMALLAILNCTIICMATSLGLSWEELTPDEETAFLNNAKIHFLESEPSRLAIECFDVNKDGIIIIGSSNMDNRYICVYDADGNFLYGYTFESNGSFRVEWDDSDNITVYYVRSDIVHTINTNGETLQVRRMLDTGKNRDYWRNEVNATSKTVLGTEYKLQKGMGILGFFSSSYSKLVAVNNDGEERIIYDVSSVHSLKVFFYSNNYSCFYCYCGFKFTKI